MKKIKFAIVGMGFIGKKHKFFIENEPLAELVATVDPVAQADYSSIDDLIRSGKEIDVVCIATPNALHSVHAKQLLNAGYHVLIEKPMALNFNSAIELKVIAQRTKRHIFLVMQNRYSPASQWLRSLIDENRLGKIFLVQVNCFWNRDHRYYKVGNWHGSLELDGGTLFTQFSHFVDLLYWCFGNMVNFKTRLFDFNHQHLTELEDSGIINFSFEQGGEGQFNFSTSCYSQNLESSITILAENGTLKIGGQYMDTVVHCDIKDYEFKEIPAFTEEFGPYKGNSANHRFVMKNIVECLNDGAEPDTLLNDGIEVVRIIEEMYKAK